MVDELRVHPNAWGPFRLGSCHMTSDASGLEELHAFARKLRLRRSWFQDHILLAHYDLTPLKRLAALRAGATFVPLRDQLRGRRMR